MADPGRCVRRILGLGLASVLLAGCGYSTRGSLPDHIKTVAVPIFKNRTEAPGLENTITSAVISAFSNGGRLRVVPVEQADSILEGELVGYQIDGAGFDRNQNVQAYHLRVVLNVTFRDVRQNKMLWQENGLAQTADFQVQGQVSDTLAQGGGAASQAATDIGRKIANAAVDLF
ncbi:MAG TPA: LptE family protein [Streptosporangiaceae bacterium]|nr:LptE family protein [Streptosporangiaceae bacterium]